MASSISDRAYDRILKEIMDGKIPAGAAISEHSLAKQLDISRTPVREAIRRLKHEGVVEQYPRCGTVVRYPSADEIRELFEFREALECYAVRRAAVEARPEDLAELDGLVERIGRVAEALDERGEQELRGPELKEFIDADMAFHQRLLELSKNRRILKSVQDSRVIVRIFGTPRQKHDVTVAKSVHQKHARILNCVRVGDGDGASRYMAEHISVSCRQALEHYEHQDPVQSFSPLDVRVGLQRSRAVEG